MTESTRTRRRYYVRVRCSNCMQECDVWFRVGEKADTTQRRCTYCRVEGTIIVCGPSTLVSLVDGHWRSRKAFRWTKVYPKSAKDRARLKRQAVTERAEPVELGSLTEKEVIPDEKLP